MTFGNHLSGAGLPSKRHRGLTRNVVGAMLAMALATSALFGVARHFAG